VRQIPDLAGRRVRVKQDEIRGAALALQDRLPLACRDAHFDHVRGLRRVAW